MIKPYSEVYKQSLTKFIVKVKEQAVSKYQEVFITGNMMQGPNQETRNYYMVRQRQKEINRQANGNNMEQEATIR